MDSGMNLSFHEEKVRNQRLAEVAACPAQRDQQAAERRDDGAGWI
jgi:hypothetical protein